MAPQSETTKPLNPQASRRCSLQQHLVRAGWELIDGVVGAHHRLHVALGHRGAECGQVGFFKVARAGIDVESMPQALGPAVHREVLAGRDGAQVLEVVALHAADEGNAHAAGQERIFAVGLLAAAPARIAKDVDVGRPERESVKDAVVAFALRLVVLGAGLVGDHVAHAVQHRCGPRWRPCRWPAERRLHIRRAPRRAGPRSRSGSRECQGAEWPWPSLPAALLFPPASSGRPDHERARCGER